MWQKTILLHNATKLRITQQHHPVAPIPAGVEDDLPNGKVRVTDRLTGMLPAIASILVWS